MPTLAELRAQTGPRPLPRSTKVVTLVEGQHLLAETEALSDELNAIVRDASRVDENGEKTGPPRKAGETPDLPPRAQEIEDRQKLIVEEMAQFQGEIGLAGITAGEWQRFKDDNPPRDGSRTDLKYGLGMCNSGAVFSNLGRFVSSWDGESVVPDDWHWLSERITYADQRDLVPVVILMHEEGLARSPKFRSSSATTETSVTD